MVRMNFLNPWSGSGFGRIKAARKNANLRQKYNEASSWALRSVDNNIGNLIENQIDDGL
jgi:hypothetical protein